MVGYQSFLSLSVLFESVNKSFVRYEYGLDGRWLSYIGMVMLINTHLKQAFKDCFSPLYAADSVKNYGNSNGNRIMVVIVNKS